MASSEDAVVSTYRAERRRAERAALPWQAAEIDHAGSRRCACKPQNHRRHERERPATGGLLDDDGLGKDAPTAPAIESDILRLTEEKAEIDSRFGEETPGVVHPGAGEAVTAVLGKRHHSPDATKTDGHAVMPALPSIKPYGGNQSLTFVYEHPRIRIGPSNVAPDQSGKDLGGIDQRKERLDVAPAVVTRPHFDSQTHCPVHRATHASGR